ncbi:MAG: 1,4-dihydroxy-2-naphthoate polyprenyltransferase [Myxococcaceae bacterium]
MTTSSAVDNAASTTGPSLWALVWTAIRPKTLSAAVAPVAVGTGLAFAEHSLRGLPALAALAGAVLIQIGTNLANDYYDFVRGADTQERVGPARLAQRGWLAPSQVRAWAFAAFAAAVVVGAYLVSVAGWPILAVGLLSLVSGYAYTGGRYPLGYHGLGDVFVFVFFGLVAVSGTLFVQALHVTVEALVAGAGVGALATAILVVNNLRDRETDAKSGKRTLAVRWGVSATRAEYVAMLGLAAVAAVALALQMSHSGPLLGLLAMPLAKRPLQRVLHLGGAALNPALGETARLLFAYSLLLSLGCVFGGLA